MVSTLHQVWSESSLLPPSDLSHWELLTLIHELMDHIFLFVCKTICILKDVYALCKKSSLKYIYIFTMNFNIMKKHCKNVAPWFQCHCSLLKTSQFVLSNVKINSFGKNKINQNDVRVLSLVLVKYFHRLCYERKCCSLKLTYLCYTLYIFFYQLLSTPM